MGVVRFFAGTSSLYVFPLLAFLGISGGVLMVYTVPPDAFASTLFGAVFGFGLYAYLILLVLTLWHRVEIGFWFSGVLTLILGVVWTLFGPYFFLMVIIGLTLGIWP